MRNLHDCFTEKKHFRYDKISLTKEIKHKSMRLLLDKK